MIESIHLPQGENIIWSDPGDGAKTEFVALVTISHTQKSRLLSSVRVVHS